LSSDEIFRFVNVRPVQKISVHNAEKKFAKYGDNKEPPFCHKIKELGVDQSKLIDLALGQLEENETMNNSLSSIISIVKTVTAERASDVSISVEDAKKAIEAGLGFSLPSYLSLSKSVKLRDWVWDSLCAQTMLPGEKPEKREEILEGVRSFFFLEFLSRQENSDMPLNWIELSNVSPIVPELLVLKLPKNDQTPMNSIVKGVTEKLDKLHKKVSEINSTISDLNIANRKFLTQASTPVVFPLAENMFSKREVSVEKVVLTSVGKSQQNENVTKEETPKTNRIEKRTGWTMSGSRMKFLSPETKRLVKARKDFELFETAEIVGSLKKEKEKIVHDFFRNTPQKAIQYVRNNPKYAAILEDTPVIGINLLPIAQAIFNIELPPSPGSAIARGIKPLGIADLLVVKQNLIYYEAGEVAHVQNVLKSEYQTSTNTKITETEVATTVETENQEETQKDNQTTDRFEMQKQAQKTVQDQMSLGAGVSITGSYGPVSVSAHADFALNKSSSESVQSATSIAKEVIDKTSSRIKETVRKAQMTRSFERFEEKNIHGFDNKLGQGHVIGVYRWLDKYYKVNLINYGRRLMMEFMIPEPAAFYRYQKTSEFNKSLSGIRITIPDKPMASAVDLQPYHLDPDGTGYMELVAKYNVQDVEPPPPLTKTISVSFAESVNPPTGNVVFGKSSEKMIVPKGYSVDQVEGSAGFDTSTKWGWCAVWVANQQYYLNPDFGTIQGFSVGFPNIVGDSFPVSVLGFGNAYDVSITAHCTRTEEEKQRWQLKTYQAIMNAYERLLAEYYQQIDSMQISQGVQIQGMNPDTNRKIEREELKKSALRLLTDNFAQTSVGGNWRYNELFNSVKDDPNGGYPEFETEEALVEGRIVQYFEQAFEWANMTYVYYPYFWGRKDQWLSVFPLNDADPLFTDFLRAGAARVLVPVRPEFTASVLYYLKSNIIWNGGDTPTFNDPLYVSIIDEIKADSNIVDTEEIPKYNKSEPTYPCIMDEWTIKLPTSLVYLQPDSNLPDFRKTKPA
jgi:hypothetical protein